VDFRVSRDISRPADEVFAFFSDASNNTRWQQGMVLCRWTSNPPISEGSTYEQRARFMGRNILSSFAVTRFVPGRLIEIETVKSTFPIQVTREVEPTGPESSRVRAHIRGGPEGLLRFLEPLMARSAKKSIESDYDRLVDLLEGKPSD
jgi:hypothetical protein